METIVEATLTVLKGHGFSRAECNSPNLSSRAQRLDSLANPIAKSRDLVFEFAIRRSCPMDNPTCFIDKIKSEAEIE
jgi:hypothetical protein